MPFRAKASIIAAAAAACALLAPAAMASPGVSHSPVQVTGKKLKSGLLPASHILAGYSVIFSNNSGGKLEHGTLFHIPSMKCANFWGFIATVKGFGETAFATDLAGSGGKTAVEETFQQSVYQFAGNHGAASAFGQIGAKYKSCRSVSTADGHGGTLRQTVHSRKAERVGGHQSLLLTEYLTDTRIGGPPVVTVALWTVFGSDVYMFSSQLLNVHSPKPTLSSLMLKLIPRIRALR
jgi:hypothetical protein